MRTTFPTWRVLQSQQDLARKNARQALLVLQQRRREQAESEQVLPLLGQQPDQGAASNGAAARAE
jgi:hypothetical protein